MHSGAVPAADALAPDEPVLVLLRAVNVGGRSVLRMADLRAAAADLGHTGVATHLATGNLLLVPAPGAPGTADALAARLAADLGDRLERPPALTVRTRADVDALVAANPYPEAAATDPAHLVVTFFDGPVGDGPLDLAAYGRETGTRRGRDAYLLYPDGIGRSTVTAAVLDRLTGRSGTSRNWRTVLALRDRLHG